MPAVHLHNLSFSYSSAVPILDDVSLSLGAGWTGVVGPNGTGKTTLLQLIGGSLSPSRGRVDLDPPDGIVVHCPQTADQLGDDIKTLAAAWDGEARSLSGRLGLHREDLDRWPSLSPGERKRWQIGAALYQDPDVLLLDEPTNHLDPTARDLLLDALDRYRGVGVIISHDRRVLNRLCRRISRVDPSGVSTWNGNYDTARAAWEHAAQEQLEGYQGVRAEQRRAERRLADKRRASATKTARHKRQLRTASIKDRDARSMEKKGKFEGGQRQGSHEIHLLRDEAERLRATAESFEVTRLLGGDLYFDYEPSRRKRLLSFDGPLRIGDTVLAEEISVALDREDRVLLAGPNGAGKSTLLARLMKTSTIEPSRLLHLPQELTETETGALVAEVQALDAATKGRVLGIVGVLGSDPKRILATDKPSPGEARKLLIASGLGKGVWALLLDEPTNHLDLPSIERLEKALAAYPGALVVVTHDDEFARETTQTQWTLSGGRLSVE